MAELSRADDAKVVLVKDASDIYAEYGMRPTHIDFLNGLGAYVHFESADDPQNEDARFLSELSEEQLARIGKEFLRMRAELKRRGMVTGDEHKFEENSQIKKINAGFLSEKGVWVFDVECAVTGGGSFDVIMKEHELRLGDPQGIFRPWMLSARQEFLDLERHARSEAESLRRWKVRGQRDKHLMLKDKDKEKEKQKAGDSEENKNLVQFPEPVHPSCIDGLMEDPEETARKNDHTKPRKKVPHAAAAAAAALVENPADERENPFRNMSSVLLTPIEKVREQRQKTSKFKKLTAILDRKFQELPDHPPPPPIGLDVFRLPPRQANPSISVSRKTTATGGPEVLDEHADEHRGDGALPVIQGKVLFLEDSEDEEEEETQQKKTSKKAPHAAKHSASGAAKNKKETQKKGGQPSAASLKCDEETGRKGKAAKGPTRRGGVIDIEEEESQPPQKQHTKSQSKGKGKGGKQVAAAKTSGKKGGKDRKAAQAAPSRSSKDVVSVSDDDHGEEDASDDGDCSMGVVDIQEGGQEEVAEGGKEEGAEEEEEEDMDDVGSDDEDFLSDSVMSEHEMEEACWRLEQEGREEEIRSRRPEDVFQDTIFAQDPPPMPNMLPSKEDLHFARWAENLDPDRLPFRPEFKYEKKMIAEWKENERAKRANRRAFKHSPNDPSHWVNEDGDLRAKSAIEKRPAAERALVGHPWPRGVNFASLIEHLQVDALGVPGFAQGSGIVSSAAAEGGSRRRRDVGGLGLGSGRGEHLYAKCRVCAVCGVSNKRHSLVHHPDIDAVTSLLAGLSSAAMVCTDCYQRLQEADVNSCRLCGEDVMVSSTDNPLLQCFQCTSQWHLKCLSRLSLFAPFLLFRKVNEKEEKKEEQHENRNRAPRMTTPTGEVVEVFCNCPCEALHKEKNEKRESLLQVCIRQTTSDSAWHRGKEAENVPQRGVRRIPGMTSIFSVLPSWTAEVRRWLTENTMPECKDSLFHYAKVSLMPFDPAAYPEMGSCNGDGAADPASCPIDPVGVDQRTPYFPVAVVAMPVRAWRSTFALIKIASVDSARKIAWASVVYHLGEGVAGGPAASSRLEPFDEPFQVIGNPQTVLLPFPFHAVRGEALLRHCWCGSLRSPCLAAGRGLPAGDVASFVCCHYTVRHSEDHALAPYKGLFNTKRKKGGVGGEVETSEGAASKRAKQEQQQQEGDASPSPSPAPSPSSAEASPSPFPLSSDSGAAAAAAPAAAAPAAGVDVVKKKLTRDVKNLGEVVEGDQSRVNRRAGVGNGRCKAFVMGSETAVDVEGLAAAFAAIFASDGDGGGRGGVRGDRVARLHELWTQLEKVIVVDTNSLHEWGVGAQYFPSWVSPPRPSEAAARKARKSFGICLFTPTLATVDKKVAPGSAVLADEEKWALDFWAGIGGLSLGAEAAGYKVAAGVDFDETVTRAFAEHFGSLGIQVDIGAFYQIMTESLETLRDPNFLTHIVSRHLKKQREKREEKEREKPLSLSAEQDQEGREENVNKDETALEQIFAIFGGFPCTGFSTAQPLPDQIRDKLKRDQRSLAHYAPELCRVMRPKYCCFENVPGLKQRWPAHLFGVFAALLNHRFQIRPAIRCGKHSSAQARTRLLINVARCDVDLPFDLEAGHSADSSNVHKMLERMLVEEMPLLKKAMCNDLLECLLGIRAVSVLCKEDAKEDPPKSRRKSNPPPVQILGEGAQNEPMDIDAENDSPTAHSGTRVQEQAGEPSSSSSSSASSSSNPPAAAAAAAASSSSSSAGRNTEARPQKSDDDNEDFMWPSEILRRALLKGASNRLEELIDELLLAHEAGLDCMRLNSNRVVGVLDGSGKSNQQRKRDKAKALRDGVVMKTMGRKPKQQENVGGLSESSKKLKAEEGQEKGKGKEKKVLKEVNKGGDGNPQSKKKGGMGGPKRKSKEANKENEEEDEEDHEKSGGEEMGEKEKQQPNGKAEIEFVEIPIHPAILAQRKNWLSGPACTLTTNRPVLPGGTLFPMRLALWLQGLEQHRPLRNFIRAQEKMQNEERGLLANIVAGKDGAPPSKVEYQQAHAAAMSNMDAAGKEGALFEGSVGQYFKAVGNSVIPSEAKGVCTTLSMAWNRTRRGEPAEHDAMVAAQIYRSPSSSSSSCSSSSSSAR